MIFNYIFLLENYSKDFFIKDYQDPLEFIIPFNTIVNGGQAELFQDLHNSKNRFCFYLSSDLASHNSKFIKEEIVQNVVRMLFLPNYIRVPEGVIFFVDKSTSQNKLVIDFKNEIKNEFKKQGVNDVVFEDLNNHIDAKNFSDEKLISLSHEGINNYLKNTNKSYDFDSLLTSLSIQIYLKARLIIASKTVMQLQSNLKLIQEFENWLVTSRPVKMKLVEVFAKVEKQNSDLLIENQLLKTKLKNSSVYLKELKQNSQWYVNDHSRLTLEVQRLSNANRVNTVIIQHPPAPQTLPPPPPTPAADNGYILQLQTQVVEHQNHATEILDWYKKEYEVLPLWYKRFGQIIKVFKGKRTFKSLFK